MSEGIRIVGAWFGWYWSKKDAKLLAKLISEGMRHIPLDKKQNNRFDSVIKRIREAAKGNGSD